MPKNLLSVGIKCSGHTLSKYHLNPLHFKRSLSSNLVLICCSSRTFSASTNKQINQSPNINIRVKGDSKLAVSRHIIYIQNYGSKVLVTRYRPGLQVYKLYTTRCTVNPNWYGITVAHRLTGIEFEVKLLPFVHPDQSYACQISVQYMGYASWKRVWRRFSKNVSDMRTRCYLNATTALPNLQRNKIMF